MTTSTQTQTESPDDNSLTSCCNKLASKLAILHHSHRKRKPIFAPIPPPSPARLNASLNDAPLDLSQSYNVSPSLPQLEKKQKTVFYLAYGSNLCDATFLVARGIRPLSQVNVLVPSLRLTFDLPGIPYSEPCFANTALRDPSQPPNAHADGDDYHKDRWHKGLVGVVYEVTLPDYAHIIATEGGGASYQDILVDCYVLPHGEIVPDIPTTPPFKAHTLFAPVERSSRARPDPSYAQPSARYLQLITSGAIERNLPAEYQLYLNQLRPYTITTEKQAAGKTIFLGIWMPLVAFLFALGRQVQDGKGRAPKWFAVFAALVFGGMWMSYDGVFKGVFGDGERTVGGDGDAGARRDDEGREGGEKEGLLGSVDLDVEVGREKGVSRLGSDIV